MITLLALLLAQTVRTLVPYVCAAVGGALSERSGVVNIALEGILLASGLGAVVVHVATGSAVAGLAAGVMVGAAFGALHALLVLRAGANAILSGLALNLFAVAGTRFLLRALYRSSSNSPPISAFRVAEGSSLLVRTFADPILWLAIVLAVATAHFLAKSPTGLRIRAAGESPEAVLSAGLSLGRLRAGAVIVGSAICGLGGVALAYDQHQFQSGMSGGRGFIALAAVVLSGWRPGRAALLCGAFAALDAAQIVLQDRMRSAQDLLAMLPYVVTLILLGVAARPRDSRGGIAAAGRDWTRAPAALGKES